MHQQQGQQLADWFGNLSTGSASVGIADWLSSVAAGVRAPPRPDELEQLQAAPDFVRQLAAALRSHPSPETRLLCSLCLKNHVRLNWRFKMSPEDKEIVRETALGLAGQPGPVALQLAVIAGLVARLDWPERWPDLGQRVTEFLRSPGGCVVGDETRAEAGLTLLHQVVKALMSKTLPKHRQQFRLLACELAPFMTDALVVELRELAARAQPSPGQPSALVPVSPSRIRCLTLCTKCISNLVTHGLSGCLSCHGDGGPGGPCRLLACAAELLPSFLSTPWPEGPELEPLSRALAKLLARCQARSVEEFAPLAEPAVKAAAAVAFSSGEPLQGGFNRDSRTVVLCLNLLTQCVISYAAPAHDSSESVKLAGQALNELFNDSALDSLVTWLMSRYLGTTQHELDEALSEPEDAVFTQTPEQAQLVSGRAASEALLQALLRELPQRRGLAAVQRVARQRLSDPATDAASLEATLALLSACPYDLARCATFAELCSACRLPHLLDGSASMASTAPIPADPWAIAVQRRALSLTGAWADVPDALNSDAFGTACAVAAEFLAPGRHRLLRLQAARLAHSLLTSLCLDANAFQPHAVGCFNGLALLLTEAASEQAQVQLLDTVASFLRYSVADLRPCLPALVPHLPSVWAAAAGDQARLGVLSVLAELAKLGDQSLGEFALPLARACLSGPELFWDSGLHLLLYLLCHLNAWPGDPVPSACLDECAACLHARAAELGRLEPDERRVLQACAYLGPDRYMAMHGQGLLLACRACLIESPPRCWSETRLQPLVLANDLLKVSPHQSAQLLSPLLPDLVARFSGPGPDPDCLLANRLAFWRIVSRVAIARPDLLLQATSASGCPPGGMLSAWAAAASGGSSARVGGLASSKLRDLKLLSLGLLLFAFADARHLDGGGFADVVEIVVGAAAQCESPAAAAAPRRSPPVPTTADDAEDQSAHQVRKKLANAADCVQRLSLVERLRAEVAGLGAALGPERFHQLLASLDSVTRTQLVELTG